MRMTDRVIHAMDSSMLESVSRTVFDWLFGCHHPHMSRVFTIRGYSYRVCIDCGARFEYSLDTMSVRRVLPLQAQLPCPSPARQNARASRSRT